MALGESLDDRGWIRPRRVDPIDADGPFEFVVLFRP